MPARKKRKQSYSIYFASELFSLKHLLGNAYLAEAIYEKSHGRYLCRLPQDVDQRGAHPHLIRDRDLRALLACDAAMFSFDGTELDSGTVVEFMFAKFADLPSVVLRSDSRSGGSPAPGNPWNLMASFYPRTAQVRMDGLTHYRLHQKRQARARARQTPLDAVTRLAGQHASATSSQICDQLAASVVRALDRVIASEPVMPKHVREEVYTWLALMPGLRGKEKLLRKEMERLLEQKVRRGLL